jgi:hypothetical protein
MREKYCFLFYQLSYDFFSVAAVSNTTVRYLKKEKK